MPGSLVESSQVDSHKSGVVSKGLLEGPMAVIWDIRWIIDLVLVGFVFSHPGFLPLLGVLRIIKILTYIERLGSLIALKEIYCIIRESYQVILSIIGIMVMCGIFVAMLLNNLVVVSILTRLQQSTQADADS